MIWLIPSRLLGYAQKKKCISCEAMLVGVPRYDLGSDLTGFVAGPVTLPIVRWSEDGCRFSGTMIDRGKASPFLSHLEAK